MRRTLHGDFGSGPFGAWDLLDKLGDEFDRLGAFKPNSPLYDNAVRFLSHEGEVLRPILTSMNQFKERFQVPNNVDMEGGNGEFASRVSTPPPPGALGFRETAEIPAEKPATNPQEVSKTTGAVTQGGGKAAAADTKAPSHGAGYNDPQAAAGEKAGAGGGAANTGALLAGSLGLQEGSIGFARNGPRLVIDQRYVSGIGNYACGPTSCAMILGDNGKWASITSLADTARIRAPLGTDVIGLSKALRANGIESANWSLHATIDDLASGTARGNAAIARMELDRGGHFVVVDGVTTRQGQAIVAVRDPGSGTQYFVPRTQFESKFSGQVVFTSKKQ